MVYYTVGANINYDEFVKNGECYKSIGGTVFKNLQLAKIYNNVFIDGKKVPSSIYIIDGNWETDVKNPFKQKSELIKPKKVIDMHKENFSNIGKKIMTMDVYESISIDGNNKITVADADKRIFPTFCFLIASEKTGKLKKLIESRILFTEYGIGKGDNLNSINSIIKELEMILNDSTNFGYTKRHTYSSVMWSIERAFTGEPVFQDLKYTQDVSKVGVNDLLPRKKNSVSIQGGGPHKAGGNLLAIHDSFVYITEHQLFGVPIVFDYGTNSIWTKIGEDIKKYDY